MLRLAKKDGCTLAEVEERYTIDEYAIWVAEYILDPWDEQRADLSRAIGAAAIANQWRDSLPIEPMDLMPNYDRPSPEDQQKLAKEIFAAQVAAWNKHLEAHGGNR